MILPCLVLALYLAKFFLNFDALASVPLAFLGISATLYIGGPYSLFDLSHHSIYLTSSLIPVLLDDFDSQIIKHGGVSLICFGK